VKRPVNGNWLGFAALLSAIICFFLTRPKVDPNDAAIKITPSSSIGARLAAIDDASDRDVRSYEMRLDQISETFKEDQAQIMEDIQKSAKVLKKDGKSATMSEYLNGLTFLAPYQPWQTIPFYCKVYEDNRREGDSNEQAWSMAGLAASAPKK
jgi:hypothetical protein